MPTSSTPIPVHIKPLRLHEVRQAHSVFTDALINHFGHFDADYTRQALAENNYWSMVRAVVHPQRLILVAKHQRKIIGYVIGSVPTGGHGQIYWLFVSPDLRGQNLGLKLLSCMLKTMAAKGAHTASLVTHDHAKYYARQGFRLVEKVEDGKTTKYVLSYSIKA